MSIYTSSVSDLSKPEKRVPDSQEERKVLLGAALGGLGLSFRRDLEICQQFVYLGQNALYVCPTEIAHLVAREKFLKEYCDYAEGVRVANQQCRNTKLPRDQWLQRVERAVLQTSGHRDFPTVWPWQQNVSPKPRYLEEGELNRALSTTYKLSDQNLSWRAPAE